jgi:hypothetical protein
VTGKPTSFFSYNLQHKIRQIVYACSSGDTKEKSQIWITGNPVEIQSGTSCVNVAGALPLYQPDTLHSAK